MTTLQIYQSADPHDKRTLGTLTFDGDALVLEPSAGPRNKALDDALAEIGRAVSLPQLQDHVDAAGLRHYSVIEVAPSDPGYPFAVASHLLSRRGWRCDVMPGAEDDAGWL